MHIKKRHMPAFAMIALAAGLGVWVLTTQRGEKGEGDKTLIPIQKEDLSRIEVEFYASRDTEYDEEREKLIEEIEKANAESAESSESGAESASPGESEPESSVESVEGESGESASAESEAALEPKRLVMAKVTEGEDEYWTFEEPIRARVAPASVDSLVERLSFLACTRTVETDKGEVLNPADYGLERPVLRLTCTGAKGKTVTVAIGKKHPTAQTERFAMVEGTKSVAVIDNSLVSDLTREAADMRDKRLFTLKSDEVKTVRIDRGRQPAEVETPETESEAAESEGPESEGIESDPWSMESEEDKELPLEGFSLEKGETDEGDAKWTLSSGAEGAADGDTASCEGLVSGLCSKSATEIVVDEPTAEDLARYGLDDPVQTFTLTGRKKKGKKERSTDTTETVTIGDRDDEGNYYAMASWKPEIMLVPGAAFDALEKQFADLRDKSLHDFTADDLESIETVRGGFQAKLLYDRKEKKWNLADGNDAKEFAVTSLVDSMVNLTASKFYVEATEDLSAYGLDAPQATVTLQPRKGDPVVLYFGSIPEDDPTMIHVKVAGQDGIVGVESYRLYSIPEKLSDIADAPVAETESASGSAEAASSAESAESAAPALDVTFESSASE